MSKLAITTNYSAAGSLSQSGTADRVVPFCHRLVMGTPSLASEMENFFFPIPGADPDRWLHWSDVIGDEFENEKDGRCLHFLDFVNKWDELELWIDPDPNSYLLLAQIIEFFSRHRPNTDNINVVFCDKQLGSFDFGSYRPENFARVVLDEHLLDTSINVWRAYLKSTPEGFASLIGGEIRLTEHYAHALSDFMNELPSPTTGLGATEEMILEIVSAGDVPMHDLFPGERGKNSRLLYDANEIGFLINGLAFSTMPAISGFSAGPYSSSLMENDVLRRRFVDSRISLTPFGKDLHRRRDVFSRYNTIDRWWGSVHITNASLWRWDRRYLRLSK